MNFRNLGRETKPVFRSLPGHDRNVLRTVGELLRRMRLKKVLLLRDVCATEDEVAEKSTFQPGTVHWMAPELMTQGIKTEKTDVYAMGVVLWELWVMKTPYAGLKVNDIAIKVRGGARPVVPDDVEPTQADNGAFKALMEQCWHEDMTHRPSAAHVVEGLGAYLASFAPAKGYESD